MITSDDTATHPHHFSVHREASDSIRVEGWNEDGTHVGTTMLTHGTALDLLSNLAVTVATNPYAL